MHIPKNKYGQNFINDLNLLNKIVSISSIDNQNVIEVGSGLGTLTSLLASNCKKVVSYEIDTDLSLCLEQLCIKHSNLKIFFMDFLQVNNQNIYGEFDGQSIILVANIPYYITTPILYKFIENQNMVKAILMIQKEAAHRIFSPKNSSSYNQLNVILQYLCEIEVKMNVSRKLFHPIPRVNSVVIELKKKCIDYFFFKKYITYVNAAFTHRRKTLVNNFINAFNINKSEFEQLLLSCGYRINIRAQELSYREFEMLIRKIDD